MAQQDKLPVQQGAWAQAAHGGAHAMAIHHVQARLRAVCLFVVDHRLLRRGGQMVRPQRLELTPCGKDLFARGGGLQLNGYALGVAIDYGDAVTVRA